jgi:hypothetical protein
MLRRHGVFLIACAGVLVAAAVLIYWSLREPRYDGRSLSHRLSRLGVHPETDRPPSPDVAEKTRAQEAIGHIGTKALPYLMRWIEYRPRTDENIFFRWVRTLFGEAKRARQLANDELRAYEAAEAFRYITNAPDSILREIAPLARDPEYRIRNRATHALNCLGEHSTAPWTVLMTNDTPGLRYYAIHRLSRFSPEQASNAVPYVVRCLKDPQNKVRIEATNALLRIAPETLGKLTVKE